MASEYNTNYGKGYETELRKIKHAKHGLYTFQTSIINRTHTYINNNSNKKQKENRNRKKEYTYQQMIARNS